MNDKFEAAEVWEQLMRTTDPLTVFMAVPTIYYKLIKYYEDTLIKTKYTPE